LLAPAALAFCKWESGPGASRPDHSPTYIILVRQSRANA